MFSLAYLCFNCFTKSLWHQHFRPIISFDNPVIVVGPLFVEGQGVRPNERFAKNVNGNPCRTMAPQLQAFKNRYFKTTNLSFW